ncbi:MAG: nucleotidyltransferase family protein [Puia sp.]|nr:nucleotidyltransferase family protein [Puia sp.]
MIREAIILAGGLGTRLRSAVPDLPKCLAPVGGIPFLSYVIDYFSGQGIEKYIFALGYKSKDFENFLQDKLPAGDYQLSIEQEPLGTGGAIRLACQKATEKTVLVLNGDTFFRIRLPVLSDFHRQMNGSCTLSLKPMRNFDRYGVVTCNEDHTIREFREKKFYENGLINGGVYALEVPALLETALPEKFSFEKDYLEHVPLGQKLYGQVQDAYFIDIGIPEDYERAQKEIHHLRSK